MRPILLIFGHVCFSAHTESTAVLTTNQMQMATAAKPLENFFYGAKALIDSAVRYLEFRRGMFLPNRASVAAPLVYDISYSRHMRQHSNDLTDCSNAQIFNDMMYPCTHSPANRRY